MENNFNLKQFLAEGIMLKEATEDINTLTELKAYLDSLVNDYVAATNEIAGEDLDWDGDGSNMGISKTELIKDFIGYLNDEIPM
ncbi:hypothetical protein N9795_00195 [Candidatus Pelagibacter sp.]|nr:hypothetical protein [Candidatus Pelagibacter sp.]